MHYSGVSLRQFYCTFTAADGYNRQPRDARENVCGGWCGPLHGFVHKENVIFLRK
jgi:hypothetical protein